jgi:hypothetical protein
MKGFFLITLLALVCASSRNEWSLAGDAHLEAHVGFYLTLPHRNLDLFDEAFVAITDPNSPRYGAYMTKEAVNDMIAPTITESESVVAKVRDACPQSQLHVVENRRE